MIKNENGCPCLKDCCDESDIHNPAHLCDEDFCEECYRSECSTCGQSCYCDL